MDGLSEQEQKFFESGGSSGVEGEEEGEKEESTPEVKPEVTSEEKPEVKPEEKKRPSKFEYSPDTDNVVDDLGRKYVPLGAIQEARNENKALKKELDDLKNKWTGGEKKLNTLLERIQGKEDAPPDYDKDPLGHLAAKNKALEEKILALEQGHSNSEKEKETNSQLAQFNTRVRNAENAFASKQADYGAAVAKVQEIWSAEFELAGLEPDQIETAISRKGAQFSYAAMQKGQNPAEAVYKLAQRLGYKVEKKEENKDKDKLKMIAKGQEAEKSLASGKGSADFSLEAIASMSDEDMEAFVADAKNWKKLGKAQ